MRTITRTPRALLGSWALVALIVSAPRVFAADYVYSGNPVTDMSGVNCRPITPTQEGWDVARDISGGLTVLSTWIGGQMSFMCPLNRRNTTTYGESVSFANIDRVLATSVKIKVYDGDTASNLWCAPFVTTQTGSFYSAPARWACSSTDGCLTQPADSYVGAIELAWSNPFGSAAIVNQGAADVGTYCAVPKNSSIYSLRGVFSKN